MKLRKLTFVIALSALSGAAMAQNFEGSTVDERIGYSNNNNEDSIKIGRGYISMFQQSISNQNWAEAYINYNWLKKYAPYAVNGIYTQGPVMFYYLIQGEKDDAKKLAYFNELMELFEARQKNLEVLVYPNQKLIQYYFFFPYIQ